MTEPPRPKRPIEPERVTHETYAGVWVLVLVAAAIIVLGILAYWDGR